MREQSKLCTKCDEVKPAASFACDRANPDGLSRNCRSCRSAYNARWYGSLSGGRKRTAEQEARRTEYQAEYYLRHKEKLRAAGKAWADANKDKGRQSTRQAMRRRRSTPKGRLESTISRGVHRGLTSGTKAGRATFDLLGYTPEQLMSHLESQFTAGMSWDNYGRWHIDHIRPLASFDYSAPTDPDFAAAWALTNLQPLWALDNIRKGARYAAPTPTSIGETPWRI